MANAKTSIIIFSGAYHTEFHIQPVVPLFQDLGYRTIPRRMRSVGETVTWEDDVEAAKAAMVSELQNEQDIVLIFHSVAGVCGCEAVNRILAQYPEAYSGRIRRVVFVASFVECVEISERILNMGMIDANFEDFTSIHAKPKHAFFNDISEEQAQPFIDALHWQTMLQQPTLETAEWTKLPLTYLVCLQDNSVLPEVQEQVAQQYGMQVVKIDAGHSPFATQREKFVEVVNGILES